MQRRGFSPPVRSFVFSMSVPNSTLGGYLSSWSEQKWGSRTRWPELLPQVVALTNTSWNRITRKSPREVLQSQADTQQVTESIRREGSKRTSTTLYDDQILAPGDHVRVSMRADGPSKIKGQLKIGQRKVGSELHWVTDKGPAHIKGWWRDALLVTPYS
jgi:hypothetical protein